MGMLLSGKLSNVLSTKFSKNINFRYSGPFVTSKLYYKKLNLSKNNKFKNSIHYSLNNYDIPFETFLSDNRMLFLTGEINDAVLGSIFNNYLYYYKQKSENNVKLLLNSPGGNTISGLSIIDLIHSSSIPTSTVSLGITASIASVILSVGEKQFRSSFPNSRILLYQPLGGVQGSAIDIEIQTKELLYLRNNVNFLLSKFTGQSLEKIEIDTDNERYLNPKDALEYNLIDHIVNTKFEMVNNINTINSVYSSKKENINWDNLKYLFIN